MIDMSDVIFDPDFASEFTVLRRRGEWRRGQFVPGAPQRLVFKGCAQPTTPRDLEQLPEGDRETGMVTFISRRKLYATSPDTDGEVAVVSDQIRWHGSLYKIMPVKDWSDHGFYKAYGKLVEGGMHGDTDTHAGELEGAVLDDHRAGAGVKPRRRSGGKRRATHQADGGSAELED